MSLGFGFALPAYPLRGGGGNNPFNQTGPTLDLSFVAGATNVGNQLGADTYTLDTNFITPQYQVAAQYAVWAAGSGLTQRNFADIVTFTRASTATYFNSAGTLTTAAINEARFDFNPSTLAAQGLLIEEQRTNSVSNNTMVGAAAGTPGTLPTTWGSFVSPTGITRSVVGTGTLNGINYIDMRFSGTPSSTAEITTYISPATSATLGQAWTSTAWMAISGGSTSNIATISLRNFELNSGAYVRETGTNFVSTISSTLVRNQNITASFGATANQIQLVVSVFATTAGTPIDITLRIGLPQLEQGAFATSVIPTTTTALTRSADVASVNTLSPWYNASASTIYGEWTNIAATMPSGSIQAISNINDTTGNNQQSLFQIQAASSKASANMFSGGVNPGRLDAGGAYSNATVKAAAAYAALDRAISVNGSAAVTSAVGALPTSVTRLELGSAFLANYLNGYLRRITYYPRRLPNADLVTITA